MRRSSFGVLYRRKMRFLGSWLLAIFCGSLPYVALMTAREVTPPDDVFGTLFLVNLTGLAFSIPYVIIMLIVIQVFGRRDGERYRSLLMKFHFTLCLLISGSLFFVFFQNEVSAFPLFVLSFGLFETLFLSWNSPWLKRQVHYLRSLDFFNP